MNKTDSRSPFSEFLHYLLPSILSMTAVAIYSFVDTFVVGRAIGAQAVAAMGLGTPVLCLFFGLGLLLGTGGGVIYAVQKGMGNTRAGQEIFTTAVVSLAVIGVIAAVLGNLFIGPLTDFLGATPGNRALTIEYLRWIISCCIITMLDLCMNSFMRNEGHPGISMIATTTGTGLNIVLDYLFVIRFNLGMGSAACATCIGSFVSVCIVIVCCIVMKTNLSIRLKLYNIRRIPEMCRIGLGSFVNEIAVSVILVVFLNRAGADFGDEGVAAYSVIQTLNMTAHSLLIGTSQAAQPIISSAYGAGDDKRIRSMIRFSLAASVTLGLICTALSFAFPGLWCSFFVEDSPATLALATRGMWLHSVAFTLSSISLVYGTYFQAKTSSLQAGMILVGRNIVFPVVMLLVLGAVPAIGSSALWIAVPVAETLGMIMAVVLRVADSRKPAVR